MRRWREESSRGAKWLSAGLVAGALLVWAAAPARAATPADRILNWEGTQYVCTGVGESKDDSRWQSFPLKVAFASASGTWLADIATEIRSDAGEVVLRTECPSPWLLVEVGPGTYRVTATAEGRFTKEATVQVGSAGQTETTIRFPEIPGR